MNRLTQEDVKFLEELANEIATQDTRGTAQPYGLTVLQENVRVVPEGFGDRVLYIFDDVEFLDDEWDRFVKYVEEEFDGEDIVEKVKKYNDFNELASDDELVDELDLKWFDCDVEKEVFLNRFNFFLTEKAAQEYLKKDVHNLRNPSLYGVHLYKNEEMKRLIEIILKFKTVKDEE